ncbi:Epoxyqueuosine reductase [bioreactor metagenome]|uniref:Epoxyqueuosine reductase n=1 Tax=bioreactor metagenome TaxID=1076179 RepID=A0A645GUL0_9ZZZZ
MTYGKNNFVYTKENGSFIILNTFLVDAELEYDAPTITCPCPPECHRCIDACPNHAILAPGRLHPQSCILYSNHVNKGVIPLELREGLGTCIHGCDICQLVCPRNQPVLKKAARKDMFIEALKKDFDLEKVLVLDEAYYRDVVHPIMYNYIRDLDLFRRNAAIALGNTGDVSHIPALEKALATSANPIVRDAAQWAIERLTKAVNN